METSKNLEAFLKLVSKEECGLLEKAKWRQANDAWLSKSGAIAIKVLGTLRAKAMSQKSLSETMGVTPQQISKIVKGRENLSLETIAKLEMALGIQIIEI